MRGLFASVLVCCLVFFQFACSVSLEQAVVGRYRGEADITELNPQLREFAKQGLTLLQSSLLEIKQGGKASLSGFGNFKGTWRIEEGRLVLTRENGEDSMEFEIEDHGKRLVPILDDEKSKFLGGARIWFKKE